MSFYVIDTQHAGKPSPSERRDRGGQLGDRTEVWATRRYGLALAEALEAAGHEVVMISDGAYPDRHARVNAMRPTAYLALHLDAGLAGRGDRGAVFHWPGSAKGLPLARSIAASVSVVTPWEVSARSADPKVYENARACMAGVQCPGLVLEPGFMDGAIGRTWLLDENNLARLGRAIAGGLG